MNICLNVLPILQLMNGRYARIAQHRCMNLYMSMGTCAEMQNSKALVLAIGPIALLLAGNKVVLQSC